MDESDIVVYDSESDEALEPEPSGISIDNSVSDIRTVDETELDGDDNDEYDYEDDFINDASDSDFIDDNDNGNGSAVRYDDGDDDDGGGSRVEVELPPTPRSSHTAANRRRRQSVIHSALLDSLESARNVASYVTDSDTDADDSVIDNAHEPEQLNDVAEYQVLSDDDACDDVSYDNDDDDDDDTDFTVHQASHYDSDPDTYDQQHQQAHELQQISAATSTPEAVRTTSRRSLGRTTVDVPTSSTVVSPHNMLRSIRRLSLHSARLQPSPLARHSSPHGTIDGVADDSIDRAYDCDDSDDDNHGDAERLRSDGLQPQEAQHNAAVMHSSMAVPSTYALPHVRFGSDDPEGLTDSEKDQWNYLVTRAREAEKGSNYEAAWHWFSCAAAIHAPQKIQDRLQKLQVCVVLERRVGVGESSQSLQWRQRT
jgi:hypothetical protein